MLYRLLATTIVLFWMTMTGLLLRRELGPGDSSLRAVPLAHVAKLIFAREQPSDLQIYQEKLVVGRMQVHPHLRAEDGQRRVDLRGAMQVTFPGVPRQRVAWNGGFDLNGSLDLQRLNLGLSFRAPATDSVEVVLDPGAQLFSYESRSGRRSIKREYSLDGKGASAWLRDQGIDPAMVLSLHNPRSAPLVVKARQASLPVRGEKIETYVISAEQGEQTLLEAHLSQLGQILRVRTFVGYSAAPDEMAP